MKDQKDHYTRDYDISKLWFINLYLYSRKSVQVFYANTKLQNSLSSIIIKIIM